MGRVGEAENYSLMHSAHLNMTTPTISPLPTQHNTRWLKVYASIFVLLLLFAILVLIWRTYRKYADKIRTKMQTERSNKYKSVSSSPPGVNDMQLQTANWSLIHTNTNDSASFTNGKIHDAMFIGGAYGSYYGDENSIWAPQEGQIDRSKIFIKKLIGDGYSAKVHLAAYIDGSVSRDIALKRIENAKFNFNDIYREIELISKCNHKNIVQYIGYYQDVRGLIHIATEYMAGGDLHKYVIDRSNRPTVGDGFNYSIQICEGMEYLTKLHIIHRDLAARNCMLNEDHTIVKITDFGLCRLSDKDYEYVSNNTQQLPFRWTAIECFGTDPKFSEKSDVWSFGVVVWEIFARNIPPYQGLDCRGVREYLSSGKRLHPVDFCPERVYDEILLKCWETLPQDRLTFKEVRMKLEKIYWDLTNTSPEYMSTNYEYEMPISLTDSP